ncbi:hypothetical protein [Massilia sp. NR 4-1]|uniref:hypothetical protein n=1 Tax=Massilia sp. NR 4-1 TaxID=1678028 RepID=UPI00167FEFD4|nr:hypothetical protein [Massilia sp. NR 4-1]
MKLQRRMPAGADENWTMALALRLQLPANSRLAKKAVQESGENIFFALSAILI